jgi:hypothetical protein
MAFPSLNPFTYDTLSIVRYEYRGGAVVPLGPFRYTAVGFPSRALAIAMALSYDWCYSTPVWAAIYSRAVVDYGGTVLFYGDWTLDNVGWRYGTQAC